MAQEYYSYDMSTEYDDDEVHYHDQDQQQDFPAGEPVRRDSKTAPSSAAKDKNNKDKKGFFSRLFSSKPKEKGSQTPSLMKQFSQKTPNKTPSGSKQRSQSAPRMKTNSWQERTATESDKQQLRAMHKAHREEYLKASDPLQRRDSFDFDDPYEDQGQLKTNPNSFYGSSFHQSMDEYNGQPYGDADIVVGGTKEPPQPYYLQSYNQLMHQRQAQQQQKQIHPNYIPPHSAHQHSLMPQNGVRSTIQRSQNNSGITTPVEEHVSRVNSDDMHHDPGLEDPAVQAFMEKRRIKKERSREEKLVKELLAEAEMLGISPSKLVPSDASTVEEKSVTYPPRMPLDTVAHTAQPKRPSQSTAPYTTGPAPALYELSSQSMDMYDRLPATKAAQPIQRRNTNSNEDISHIQKLRSQSYDSSDGNHDAMKGRPLPPEPQPVSSTPVVHSSNPSGPAKVTPTATSTPAASTTKKPTAPSTSAPASLPLQMPQAQVSSSTTPSSTPVVLSQTHPQSHPDAAVGTPVHGSNSNIASSGDPASAANTPISTAATESTPHPLHDFVGIPKGVNFDPLHVMHNDNAEILKIAAALLQKARRHPQLPKTEGIPREVAAAQLATMWLNQATFVRRRADPAVGGKPSSSSNTHGKSSASAHKPLAPFPKVPKSEPAKPRKEVTPPTERLVVGASNSSSEPAAVSNMEVPAPPPPAASIIPTVSAPPNPAGPAAAPSKNANKQALPVAANPTTAAKIHNPYLQQPQQQYYNPGQEEDRMYEDNYGEDYPVAVPPRTHRRPSQQQQQQQSQPQYSAPPPPPPPPAAYYDNLARSGSRDYTPDNSSPYLQPQGSDSPPGGLRSAGGRKIMRVPIPEENHHSNHVNNNPPRRPSPLNVGRPDYARERSISEGRLENNNYTMGINSNNNRPMMSRQSSANPPPPTLLQQVSRRGFQQQQQQQQPYEDLYDTQQPQQQYQTPPFHQRESSQPSYNNNNAYHMSASYDIYDDPRQPTLRNQHSQHNQQYYRGGMNDQGEMDDEEYDSYEEAFDEDDYNPQNNHHQQNYYAQNTTSNISQPYHYSINTNNNSNHHFHPTMSTMSGISNLTGNTLPLPMSTPGGPVPVVLTSSGQQVSGGGWACKFCTLINEGAASRCSACEAPRSKGPLIV